MTRTLNKSQNLKQRKHLLNARLNKAFIAYKDQISNRSIYYRKQINIILEQACKLSDTSIIALAEITMKLTNDQTSEQNIFNNRKQVLKMALNIENEELELANTFLAYMYNSEESQLLNNQNRKQVLQTVLNLENKNLELVNTFLTNIHNSEKLQLINTFIDTIYDSERSRISNNRYQLLEMILNMNNEEIEL
ncbi:23204_t:CDS:1, partial [Cetraspora pellucida]